MITCGTRYVFILTCGKVYIHFNMMSGIRLISDEGYFYSGCCLQNSFSAWLLRKRTGSGASIKVDKPDVGVA